MQNVRETDKKKAFCDKLTLRKMLLSIIYRTFAKTKNLMTKEL